MKEKVIVFGTADLAQLAEFYLRNDSNYEVVSFTVHEKYLKGDKFCGKPVLPFENIEEDFPATEFKLFAPMTATKMNKDREQVYNEGKAKGYTFVSYISSKATIWPEAEIGENCFILEDNTIQPFTPIGNNVMIWSGNHIGHHGEIKDHVFFTSHVVLSGHCQVGPYSFFGVNSTIRDRITIGEGSLIAMGATVFKSTEPWSIYKGNPGRKQDKLSHEIM